MAEYDSSRQPTRLSPQCPAAGEQAYCEVMALSHSHTYHPHIFLKHTSTCTHVAVMHTYCCDTHI